MGVPSVKLNKDKDSGGQENQTMIRTAAYSKERTSVYFSHPALSKYFPDV